MNDTNKAAHTPGPWVVDAASDDRNVVGVADASGKPICDLWHGIEGWTAASGVTTKDWKLANARLIAAAPELLDVAKRSAAALTSAGVESNANSDNPLEVLLHTTIAAIAKATGAPA